ncbi:MAG: hypothetical protein Q9211_004280 [Gyalolechia sp. 1 TL-2023]
MFSLRTLLQLLLGSAPVMDVPSPPEPHRAMSKACVGNNHTIIIGGGVISLSTAYYLALAQRELEPKTCIYVVDSSPKLFAAASGHATAAVSDGRKEYGFSGVNASEVVFKEDAESQLGSQWGHVKLPKWFKGSDQYMAKPEPYNVAAARRVENDAQATPAVPSVIMQQGSQYYTVPAHNIVIAAGPWSQRVLATLYPEATVKLFMDTTHSAGNHLVIKTPGYKPIDDEQNCEQLFLDKVLDHPLDISTLLGGTMYIGSYGAEPEELPENAIDVHAQPKAVEAIKRLCLRALEFPKGEELEIVQAGRCYRPEVKQGHPIIAEVPISLLNASASSRTGHIHPRLFFNTGHGPYGITQGPGSGKVMSELIMGVQPSVNISGLGYDGNEKEPAKHY